MEKSKTHGFKGEIYAKIPESVVKKLGIDPGDAVFFKEEGEKIVMSAGVKGLSDDELSVLKKVNSVRHYERTMHNVMNILTGTEPNVLDDLFKRKVLFEYEKEGNKLVGISREYFPYVAEKESSLLEKLLSDGFLVLEDQRDVSEINQALTEKKHQVRGVRGFDRKFYIVTEAKYSEARAMIMGALNEEKSDSKLCEDAGVKNDLCKAVLEVMKEEGDVIEKRRGFFARA